MESHELVDADANALTTSPGAPSGITRIGLPTDFVPFTVKESFAPKAVGQLAVGDRWPGEYLAVGGVTVTDYSQIQGLIQAPAPGARFTLSDLPGEYKLEILDLNPWIVVSMIGGRPQFSPNPNFRTLVQAISLPSYSVSSPPGRDLNLTVITQASPRLAYVYGYDPSVGNVVVMDFDTLQVVPTPVPFSQSRTSLILKPQDDSVQWIDTQSASQTGSVSLDSCMTHHHTPTSLVERNTGDKACSTANYGDATASIINLSAREMGNRCTIETGGGPIDIAVQPVVSRREEADVI